MQREHTFPIAAAFVCAYSFCYFLAEIVPLPLWWYYPLEHRWELSIGPDPGLPMGWYGRLIFCALAGIFSAGLTTLWLRWRPNHHHHEAWALLDLSAMAATLFALYYIARVLTAASNANI
jgi:hypothetical protein